MTATSCPDCWGGIRVEQIGDTKQAWWCRTCDGKGGLPETPEPPAEDVETLAALLHPWLDHTPHCPYRPQSLCPNTSGARRLAALLAERERVASEKAARETAERIALAIEATFSDPDRIRPLATDAQVSTDFASDAQWCAQIARAEVTP